MNSKLTSTTAKKSNAIFLAIVLVAGTITALSSSSTSSFIVGAEAQRYYDDGNGGIDNRYDSYGQMEYSSEDTDKNSYGQMEYSSEDTDKNSYEPTTSYGMDDNSYDNKKSYETNSYEPTDYTDKNNYDNSYDKSQYQSSSSTSDYYKLQYPSYEGKDDRRDKSKDSSKSVSINKLNCINTNININGNNAGNVSIGNKGQGDAANAEGNSGAYSSDGSSGEYGSEEYYDRYNNNKKDKGFDCIINNNNTNFETISPEPSKASLKVIKNVTCTYLEPGQLNPQLACGRLVEEITEDQFLIEVTNDNPVPSQFPGSESGTIVTLGAGNYIVSETIDASVQEDIEDLEKEFFDETNINYEIDGPITTFTGDCIPVNADSEATGTIRAGESQTCEIENHFEIGAVTSAFTTGSSITTQETEDSYELTALAKITKLKQQWLDQIS